MNNIKIKGFEHYLINNVGEVYAPHIKRFINPYDNGLGYKALKLRHKDGKRKQFYVHRLVAMQFLENINNLTDVNHKDGDKSNNHVDNLEWSSHSDNLKHAFENDLLKGFVLTRSKKYTNAD